MKASDYFRLYKLKKINAKTQETIRYMIQDPTA